MRTVAEAPNNVVELDRHPTAWTDLKRIERALKSKRVEAPVVQAAGRFAAALPPLGESLPRCWTAPLIDSLPQQPTQADLERAVAGAARYFEYLDDQGALDRGCATVCEYDLLTGAHVVEELLRAGLNRSSMALEQRRGAAQRVAQHDAEVAKRRTQGIAGEASWLGGWVQRHGTWAVVWVPAGGGVAVAGATAAASERAQALTNLYMQAFMHEAKQGRAPARLAVFSVAQERAMQGLAREAGIHPLPLYRLRESSALRFWADELILG